MGIYYLFDPALVGFFPSCPFYSLTGLLCPGCGAQRAIHHLLNLQFSAAFNHNGLLLVSIPYLLLGMGFNVVKSPSEKALRWRKIFYGKKAIMLVLVVVISFWIFRNVS